MPLRIAFDLDGVLADMQSALVRHAGILFDSQVDGRSEDRVPATSPETDDPRPAEQEAAERSPDSIPPRIRTALTVAQQRQLWRHVESIPNFWESLAELEPGVVARLYAMARDRRWETIFLTTRPQTAGDTVQVQSQRWLEANGFFLPSVFVVQGSRGRVAAALGLDVVIDDRLENCVDVVTDSQARAILIRRQADPAGTVARARLGILVADSVNECLDVLASIDPGGSRGPKFLSRLKRLLGGGGPLKT